MSDANDPKKITSPLSVEQAQAALLDTVDKMVEVLYFWMEEYETEDLEDVDNLSEFVSHLWNIAMLCVVSIGFKPFGVGDEGEIYAEIQPVKDVKKLLIDKGFGLDGEPYFSDNVPDKGSDREFNVLLAEAADGSGPWAEYFKKQ